MEQLGVSKKSRMGFVKVPRAMKQPVSGQVGR